MSGESERRELGMDRRIPRRDFLNGVAIGIAGTFATATVRGLAAPQAGGPGAAQPARARDYPPARTGLRGQYPAAVETFADIQGGAFAGAAGGAAELNEPYDLVIVGGGISGLSTAYFWAKALPDQKILVLDNHDDFGGHAKRNEFTYGGRTFIGFGGTMGIATPFPYSYTAKSLIADLGVQVERNSEFLNRDLFEKYELGVGTFFDKEHFGEDRLVAGNPRRNAADFFAKAPLSEAARRDLIRLHGKNPDYMAGLGPEEKAARLEKMSYQDFLLNVAHMSPDALPFFLGQGGRNNKRVDTTPALEAARRGSVGFNGLGLELDEGFGEGSYVFHFPDGNASIARLLVNRLVPGAIAGKLTMDTIVEAPVDYGRLDVAGSSVRIRLSSPVVRVRSEAKDVQVVYVNGGKTYAVRGRNCVLACYNQLIPGLLPELPAHQKEALLYPAKVPMMYNNVLVRRWTAFQKLGVSNISAPGMYHPSTSIDPGSKVGGYRGITTPDEPAILHLVRNPNKPGLPRKEQNRLGQQELLNSSFEQFELEIRRQLARMLAGGGFDPAGDIVGITVNRWPLGYAYTYDTLGDPDVPPEQRPHVIGRRRFGRVAIANSDAGAAAFTNQAIDEANRAVEELLVANGLT